MIDQFTCFFLHAVRLTFVGLSMVKLEYHQNGHG